jgi:AcrR family transcriptional regulator
MLIAAAVEIIRSEGYAALSARRLAEKVGLKRQIVHYYFRTIEELLLSVVRFYGDSGLALMADVMKKDPLRAIWAVQADASATTFAFIAMASHRPAVKAELRRYLEEFQKLQVEAITEYFKSRGITPKIPPAAMALIIQSVSEAISAAAALGSTRGHAETRAVMESLLKNLAEEGRFAADISKAG